MRAVWVIGALVAAGVAVAARAESPATATAPPSPPVDGAAIYDRYCLPCHGSAGDGKGPAAPWLWPRPRDFTRGEYKWRSTASGTFPTDLDLADTVRLGVAGTSMHGFGVALDDAQIAAVVDVIKGFAPERAAAAGELVTVDAPPPALDLDRGRALYGELGCAACHGDGGRGDGPSAAELVDAVGRPSPPYDLTARPLRRPHAPGGEVAAIYLSLVTGLDGTAMPSFSGAVSGDDLWAVAAFAGSILYRPGPDAPPQPDPTIVDPLAIQGAKGLRLEAGYWPGDPDSPDYQVFGELLTFQGEPPAVLAPAQTSLQPAQCGRCHAKQLREWRTSLHAKTSSPGLVGQAMRVGGRAAESCYRCHAPLAEQLPRVRPGHRGGDAGDRAYARNPLFDEPLRDEGLACAACHVRDNRRVGPPRAGGNAGLLSQPGYPLTELPIFERSDFCLPCHQLPPRLAVNGRPLLNTYREWLEGPYMRRGIQCQSCHMPNREHTWLGVHDPETFRQGIELDVIAGRGARSGAVSVRARVTNVGAGHYLPTTPTPAAFLSIELLDASKRPIPGARDELRIGRHIVFEGGKFVELEDTRIPPGDSIELARAWKHGRVPDARWARIVVRVEPDNYYEYLFGLRLRSQKLSATVRALFEEGLARTRASKFVALERLVPIR